MHILSAIIARHSDLSNRTLFCPAFPSSTPNPKTAASNAILSSLSHPFPSSSSSSSSSSSASTATLRYVNDPALEDEESEGNGGEWVPSASALASSSPFEFTLKLERDPKYKGIVIPSLDFQRLCLDQLAHFRRIVELNALLSKYRTNISLQQ